MVEILSAANPSVVNSCDEEGWAPLHSAASSGNIKIVEILLNSGECLKNISFEWFIAIFGFHNHFLSP